MFAKSLSDFFFCIFQVNRFTLSRFEYSFEVYFLISYLFYFDSENERRCIFSGDLFWYRIQLSNDFDSFATIQNFWSRSSLFSLG